MNNQCLNPSQEELLSLETNNIMDKPSEVTKRQAGNRADRHKMHTNLHPYMHSKEQCLRLSDITFKSVLLQLLFVSYKWYYHEWYTKSFVTTPHNPFLYCPLLVQ